VRTNEHERVKQQIAMNATIRGMLTLDLVPGPAMYEISMGTGALLRSLILRYMTGSSKSP